MPIYQLTGLSGSGKTTLANRVSALLEKQNIETEIIRRELTEKYGARTIWIQCSLEMLRQRDPKGLYQRAFLPEGIRIKSTILRVWMMPMKYPRLRN